MQSWNSSLLFIEFVTLKMELSIHRQSFRNSIPPLKNVRKRGAAPLDCCAWTMYGKMYTHSALIFKKAKLQEARGQIGWTGAVGKSTEERCSRMHLCTCNRASNRGGWLAGWPPTSWRGGGTRDFREQFVSMEEDFCGGPSCALYSIRREIVTNDIVRPT